MWDLGTIPKIDDIVHIRHKIVIDTDIESHAVIIDSFSGAGLTVDPPYIYSLGIQPIRINVSRFRLMGMYPDNRVIDLSGSERVGNVIAGISCVQNMPGFKFTGEIDCLLSAGVSDSAIMSDPLPLSITANIKTTTKMSEGKQSSRWRYGGIRSGKVTIQWPKKGLLQEGREVSIETALDRMTRQPLKVLVYTPSWTLFGYITNVSGRESGGSGWFSVEVSVTEG